MPAKIVIAIPALFNTPATVPAPLLPPGGVLFNIK